LNIVRGKPRAMFRLEAALCVAAGETTQFIYARQPRGKQRGMRSLNPFNPAIYNQRHRQGRQV